MLVHWLDAWHELVHAARLSTKPGELCKYPLADGSHAWPDLTRVITELVHSQSFLIESIWPLSQPPAFVTWVHFLSCKMLFDLPARLPERQYSCTGWVLSPCAIFNRFFSRSGKYWISSLCAHDAWPASHSAGVRTSTTIGHLASAGSVVTTAVVLIFAVVVE